MCSLKQRAIQLSTSFQRKLGASGVPGFVNPMALHMHMQQGEAGAATAPSPVPMAMPALPQQAQQQGSRTPYNAVPWSYGGTAGPSPADFGGFGQAAAMQQLQQESCSPLLGSACSPSSAAMSNSLSCLPGMPGSATTDGGRTSNTSLGTDSSAVAAADASGNALAWGVMMAAAGQQQQQQQEEPADDDSRLDSRRSGRGFSMLESEGGTPGTSMRSSMRSSVRSSAPRSVSRSAMTPGSVVSSSSAAYSVGTDDLSQNEGLAADMATLPSTVAHFDFGPAVAGLVAKLEHEQDLERASPADQRHTGRFSRDRYRQMREALLQAHEDYARARAAKHTPHTTRAGRGARAGVRGQPGCGPWLRPCCGSDAHH